MQRHERNPRLRVIALAAVLMVGLWQGVALAGPGAPDVSGPEPPSVDGPPAPDTGDAPDAPSAPSEEPSAPSAPSGSSTTSSQPPPAPSAAQPASDDDIDPHETEDPQAPPHASGEIADVTLLDGNLPVVVGRTYSEVDPEDGDSSRSDVTVLAIGGSEIVGAHADSEGDTQDSEGGARIACEESEGQICLGLLYARATATEDDDSSQASGDTSLLFVCLGGTNANATSSEECNEAPIAAGVSEAHSDIQKNKKTGESSASQETRLANVCLGGEDPITGECGGLGAEAVEAESRTTLNDTNNNNDTRDDRPTTTRSSRVVGLEAGGEPVDVLPTEPAVIAIGPGFPDSCEDPSLLCVWLNQGESHIAVGAGGSRQEAIHLELPYPGGAIAFGHLGTAETFLVGQLGEEDVRPPCPEGFVRVGGRCLFPCPPDGEPLVEREEDCPGGGGGGDGDGDIVSRGGLAVTGAGLLPLFAVSLVLAAGGVGAITTERRRRMP